MTHAPSSPPGRWSTTTPPPTWRSRRAPPRGRSPLAVAVASTATGAAPRNGERSTERTNQRNGYRMREWDTRAGTVELSIPTPRQGSYFPDWLLERRRRAEQALVSVVATSYLLGVSTRRVGKLVAQLGGRSLSKSQVCESAAHLDPQVEAFRNRPLHAAHCTFLWLDAPAR